MGLLSQTNNELLRIHNGNLKWASAQYINATKPFHFDIGLDRQCNKFSINCFAVPQRQPATLS